MSNGAGGGTWRGGSGGWQNQFISPSAAGMGPNQYGSGMMNGGPTSTYNGTSEQMQQKTLDYFRQRGLAKDAAARARGEDVPLPFSMTDVRDQNGQWHQGPDAELYDPRRSPDVSPNWRINQPYAGPVSGVTQPPNGGGWSSPGYSGMATAGATSTGMGAAADPRASPSAGGAPMQTGGASMPYWGATSTGNPNMYAGGNPNFNERAPTGPNMYAGGNPNFNERAPYQGLLSRAPYAPYNGTPANENGTAYAGGPGWDPSAGVRGPW